MTKKEKVQILCCILVKKCVIAKISNILNYIIGLNFEPVKHVKFSMINRTALEIMKSQLKLTDQTPKFQNPF